MFPYDLMNRNNYSLLNPMLSRTPILTIYMLFKTEFHRSGVFLSFPFSMKMKCIEVLWAMKSLQHSWSSFCLFFYYQIRYNSPCYHYTSLMHEQLQLLSHLVMSSKRTEKEDSNYMYSYITVI